MCGAQEESGGGKAGKVKQIVQRAWRLVITSSNTTSSSRRCVLLVPEGGSRDKKNLFRLFAEKVLWTVLVPTIKHLTYFLQNISTLLAY